jgi:YceI-like domain
VTSSIALAAIERFELVAAETTMTFFTRMEHWTSAVYGRATALTGFIQAGWDSRGIALKPPPQIHVEFKVEQLTSGNDFKDQAIWKIIDSKRFPLISADLIALHQDEAPDRYVATGQITLAGIARRREGTCTIGRSGDRLTFDGKIAIDVRDFGLRAQRLLIFSIEPAIMIHLHLVADRS